MMVTREVGAGLRTFGAGLVAVFRRPRLLLIGALPAVVTSLLYLAGIIALVSNLDGVTGWLTGFAADWPVAVRTSLRVLLGLGLLAGSLWLGVITFVAITMAIGGPFYEHIAVRLEDDLGGVPGAVEFPWWRSLLRGLGDALPTIGVAILIAVGVLLIGLIPVVGPFLAPVVGALVGGWMISLEVVGTACERRGLRLADRNRLLRRHRVRTLAFGIPVYLLCLIPILSILVMPIAVAGGTLLTRELLGPEPGPDDDGESDAGTAS